MPRRIPSTDDHARRGLERAGRLTSLTPEQRAALADLHRAGAWAAWEADARLPGWRDPDLAPMLRIGPSPYGTLVAPGIEARLALGLTPREASATPSFEGLINAAYLRLGIQAHGWTLLRPGVGGSNQHTGRLDRLPLIQTPSGRARLTGRVTGAGLRTRTLWDLTDWAWSSLLSEELELIVLHPDPAWEGNGSGRRRVVRVVRFLPREPGT